jgi:phospholipase D1/2
LGRVDWITFGSTTYALTIGSTPPTVGNEIWLLSLNSVLTDSGNSIGYIKTIEENSGIKFNAAQVALARKWISGDVHTDQKTVTVAKAQVTKEGIVESDKTEPTTEVIDVPESDEAAQEIVTRFEHAALNLRRDTAVSDSVAQHLLEDSTSLLEEKWLGTEEEELKA